MKPAMAPVLVALAALLSLPFPVRGQLPISFEAHAGMTLPTGELDDDSKSGLALGARVFLDISEFLSVYGGFSQNDFPCDAPPFDVACSSDEEFESTGISAGARGSIPLGSSLRPWASLGALFHDLEVGQSEADGDTGFEVGVGLEIELWEMISLGPQVRYRSYSLEVTDISFFSFEAGARFYFPTAR